MGFGHVMEDTRVMSELTLKGIENETINLFDDGSALESINTYQIVASC